MRAGEELSEQTGSLGDTLEDGRNEPLGRWGQMVDRRPAGGTKVVLANQSPQPWKPGQSLGLLRL